MSFVWASFHSVGWRYAGLWREKDPGSYSAANPAHYSPNLTSKTGSLVQ